MAFSLNKIMLIGNLGGDAENRFTTTNISVTSFSLATTRSYKGKDGNWVNETTWHNVVAYSLPDFFKDALKKGKKFYVEGRISKRDYTDKEGIKRYITEVISERLIPLEGRETSGGESYAEKSNYENDSQTVAEDNDLPF
ncbi:MAG: single-stranded DNA-binding protein [Ignavibacteriales bacterium]|nr:single-stranded DNA-binding protein [Ignavibacteriales bacterium]